MQQNYSLNLIESIIQFIEDNVHNRLTLEDIAGHSNISMFHLHRLFKALTNKKLINYVKSRKLAHSINELLNSDLRVIDIANEYNFGYEQSYIRAFTREYGVSPNEFRKMRCQLPIIEKIDLNHINPIGTDGLFFNAAILIKPGFFITGIRKYVNNEKNDQTFELTDLANDFFNNHRFRISNGKNPSVYIGFIEHIPQDLAYRYYTASIEVSDLEKIPEGMYGRFIPTYKYAVFKYIGMHPLSKTTIRDLLSIHYIGSDWIRNSNYKVADKFRFERADYEISGDDYCEVEIYVPIVDKSEYVDIDYSWILR